WSLTPSLRDASSQERSSGFDSNDPADAASLLQANNVADHGARFVSLGFPTEHGAHRSGGCGHPVRGSVALQDRAEDDVYHSPGARLMASSRWALTSYKERLLSRSAASSGVLPHTSTSVSR